ncbi:hypothetical protein AB833_27185 [Chromatiales bacterium (ex Bugula neritina AB1)]|nr:hypothetical protein AB833_27185 [Chromatiales bacterium (ex Bugula neritina AB1)]
MSVTAFTPIERRAAASLSLVYATRMMGLFLLLPVMSILGQDLAGATPLLIGLALGVYGLCQAVFQIPFGLVSDRIGRKPVIYFGLMLFVAGSLVAAVSDSIWGVIAGRALQGAGAISAAVMALAADLSREDQRTKMMAIIGASIGLSFIVSIMLGPALMSHMGLAGIFLLIAALGVLAALLVRFGVPEPRAGGQNREVSVIASDLGAILKNRQLQKLDMGILLLHLLITATFVCVPLGLLERGIPAGDHWQVYLTACLASLLIMIPLIGLSERGLGIRRVMMISIIGLAVAEFSISTVGDHWWTIVFAITLFFGFLNVLESMLPSLVSRIAPVGSRGSAMGVYATSQFSGAFLGGILGGWAYGELGLATAHILLGVLTLLWLWVIRGMQEPQRSTGYQLPLDQISPDSIVDTAALEKSIRSVKGVVDVSVMADEGMAYLKINRKLFDEQELKAHLAG